VIVGMNANRIRLRPTKVARIEIIPLIDVIFFLLATFVLFTLSLTRVQSLEVKLPFAGPPSELIPVNIQVSDDGSLYWNQDPIFLGELPARIVAYKAQEQDPRVVISSDGKARLGSAILVLDELRKAGIKKFSVETKTRSAGM